MSSANAPQEGIENGETFEVFVLETFSRVLNDFRVMIDTCSILETRVTSQGKRIEALEDELRILTTEYQSHTHFGEGL